MTAQTQITSIADHVNSRVLEILEEAVPALLSGQLGGRSLELAVWPIVLEIGALLLTAALGMACWRVMYRETSGEPVRLRLDDDYTLTTSTTFGRVSVPLFAWRDGGQTRAPAREEVFPLHPKCRSSELLLEWEARVGSQLPFRQAEDALTFFSHGAARSEDTTISRHIGVVGSLLDQRWTCRAPEKVLEILENRATRDLKTGQPLLYGSTDAHALNRYVDDTWKAEPKMINGVRFWCIDRKTGQTIHIGGEYTWGDCREVGRRVAALLKHLLPSEHAVQLVFIVDGMPWIREHVHPVLPEGTRLILDFYHLASRLETYAAARFGAKTKAARRWVRTVVKHLTGKRPYRKKLHKRRKGHKKRKRRSSRPFRTVNDCPNPHGAGELFIRQLIDDEPASDALEKLMLYVAANLDRIDYSTYRAHGSQIGSGAMESLHRTASQMRLKLAGARWTAEKAIAVLNLRLMTLAERWSDFWSQAHLTSTLSGAFHTPAGVP